VTTTQRELVPRRPIGRWPLEKPFPVTLHDIELMEVLGIGHSNFYRRKKSGEFRFLEVRPQLAKSVTLYSGRLVEQWVNGELQMPKYFAGARSLRVVSSESPRRGPGRPRKRAVGEE
jgi:hypothetical protein